MKNIFHAEMAQLIRREKEIEKELEELRDGFGTWKERVELARKADRNELAQRAEERIDELRLDARGLRDELKSIITQKKKLRKESRRPSGQEVRRAEALLESFRQSGLIDPEEAQLDSDLKDAELEGQLSELRSRETDGHIADDEPKKEPLRKKRGAVSDPDAEGTQKKHLEDFDLEDLESLDADELERLISDDTDGDL